ncbi:MAG: glycosyltransferase family 4 protein [Thermoleophilia bacterium]
MPGMKICLVYEYYHPHVGGAEVLMQHLAEGLAARGHECHVVTSRLPRTPARETLAGVEIHRVAVPRLGDRYWFTFLAFPLISRVAAGCDLVQVGTYNGAITARLAARRHRKPVVLYPFEVLGGLWLRIGLNPLAAAGFRLFEKAVLAFPYDAYSCISEYTRGRLLESARVPAGKAFLAYPGIDYGLFDPEADPGGRERVRRLLGLDDSTFLCIYTGRPGVVKGVEYLLKAMPEIKRKVPAAKLLLLLSKKPRAKYRQTLRLIDSLGMDDIILRPPVPRGELPLYFQASDCVIIPSLSEGFGFTCIEASTMRKPVVATDAGSLPEVTSGCYVTVPARSSLALAEGVERVFRGAYQTSRLKRFSWDETIDRHLEAYAALLEQHPGQI